MRDAEFEQRLLRVARGLEKADLVLKGGNVFNSFTGEWETADIAVCGSVIAGIGSYKGAEEYNMAGKYLTPGFLDAHMHIETCSARVGASAAVKRRYRHFCRPARNCQRAWHGGFAVDACGNGRYAA